MPHLSLHPRHLFGPHYANRCSPQYVVKEVIEKGSGMSKHVEDPTGSRAGCEATLREALHEAVEAPSDLVDLPELLEESKDLAAIAQAVLDAAVHPVPLTVGLRECRARELCVALHQGAELVASRRELQHIINEIEHRTERPVVKGRHAELPLLPGVLGGRTAAAAAALPAGPAVDPLRELLCQELAVCARECCRSISQDPGDWGLGLAGGCAGGRRVLGMLLRHL
mmetsp:Transcript_128876/g.358828  ORF Transcript_128876/g.358828 Transcript_128876/m.358828 type:complete len:226 (+) Transcript_128876:583-1260(+)